MRQIELMRDAQCIYEDDISSDSDASQNNTPVVRSKRGRARMTAQNRIKVNQILAEQRYRRLRAYNAVLRMKPVWLQKPAVQLAAFVVLEEEPGPIKIQEEVVEEIAEISVEAVDVQEVPRTISRRERDAFELTPLPLTMPRPAAIQISGVNSGNQFYPTLTHTRPLRLLVAQECAICQLQISKYKGVLPCDHEFCLSCILKSSQFSTKCPMCRGAFSVILDEINGKVIRNVEERELEIDQQQEFEEEPCYVCGRNDNQDQMLLCDYCDGAFCHVLCDHNLGGVMPEGEWFCSDCKLRIQEAQNQRHRRARRGRGRRRGRRAS